jgi:hypothetical protein
LSRNNTSSFPHIPQASQEANSSKSTYCKLSLDSHCGSANWHARRYNLSRSCTRAPLRALKTTHILLSLYYVVNNSPFYSFPLCLLDYLFLQRIPREAHKVRARWTITCPRHQIHPEDQPRDIPNWKDGRRVSFIPCLSSSPLPNHISFFFHFPTYRSCCTTSGCDVVSEDSAISECTGD